MLLTAASLASSIQTPTEIQDCQVPRPRCSPFLLPLLVLVIYFVVPYSALAQASVTGQWSALETWSFRPIHSHLLPTGKVLFWSYYNEALTPQLWDPQSDSVTPAANIGYSIFCSGHSFLADGSLLVTGGHIADYVGYTHASIYNPFTNSWSAASDMTGGRWYPTNTTLPSGDVLVTSGDLDSNTNDNTLPQVYQAASGTWRNLTTAQLALALYPRAFVAPNGQVFDAGPEPTSRYLDTSGTGKWTTVATQSFTPWRDYGSAVMYDSGKILAVGGADPPTATAEVIDLNAATPKWTSTGSMSSARRQHNATVLPDGTVLVTGGSSGSGFDNSATPVNTSEIWDPKTGAFTVLPGQAVYRGYHSFALLLPDGRVVAGGGNVGGPNAQVYSPAYLFKGARPTYTNAPGAIGYGGSFNVSSPDAASITDVTLIRNGSVTHSFNTDQRLMHLAFTKSGNAVQITGPANANLAPPGYYMLFLLANGIPSVANIVQVSATAATGGTITGQVNGAGGTPLAGATVSYSNGSASTDASGTYTLSNVAAGTVTITATANGFVSQSQTVTVTDGASVTANVFNLVQAQVGTVTGTVQSSAGAALSGVTVAFSGASTTTNSTGAYTLSGVPAGSQQLTASLSGFISSSQTVTVTANTSVTANFTLSAAPTGTIMGRVTSASGTPVSGASVVYGGGPTTTDCGGYYSFTNVPAGTVTVEVTATGFQSAQQNVNVPSGSGVVASFTLTASPPPTTTGTVSGVITRIGTTQALAGATVKFSGGSTTTNTSGAYTLGNVPAGTASITASASGYLARTQTVTVNSGATSTLNIQLSTAGRISGTVTNASGAAVANATITITGGGIPTTVTLKTSSTGTYLTAFIPIGSYSVSAALTGHTTQNKTVSVTAGVTATLNFTSF